MGPPNLLRCKGGFRIINGATEQMLAVTIWEQEGTPMPRAAIYLRVSKDRQDTERQRIALLALVQHRGYELVGVYAEKVSRRAPEHPERTRLMEASRRGEFDVLLVDAIDRFGQGSDAGILLEELHGRGVEVVTTQAIDFRTPAGQLIQDMLLGVSRFELALMSARIKSGMAAAKAKGKRIGRAPLADAKRIQLRALRYEGKSYEEIRTTVGVGLATVRKYTADIRPRKRSKHAGRPPLTTDNPTLRRRILDLRVQGKSLRAIAAELGISTTSVQRYAPRPEKLAEAHKATQIREMRETMRAFKTRDHSKQKEVRAFFESEE